MHKTDKMKETWGKEIEKLIHKEVWIKTPWSRIFAKTTQLLSVVRGGHNDPAVSE